MIWIIEIVKDLSPTIIGVAALIISSRNITRQIRKSSKNQWIETFRANIVKFYSSYYEFDLELNLQNLTHITHKEYANHISYLRLLLDRKVKLQNELYIVLKDIFDRVNDLSGDIFNDSEYIAKKVNLINNLVEQIINQEQMKI